MGIMNMQNHTQETNELKTLTRHAEEAMARLFSISKPFSDHLTKWEDDALPDKYDHNCFEYSAQPTADEFQKALAYQRAKSVNFIKLEGDFALTETFGLEAGVTLTMVLQENHPARRTNEILRFHTPAFTELEALEVKHYGPVYGEDFSRRNIKRLYEKLDYIGAYLDDKLVGACYCFRAKPETSSCHLTCIDGILVDTAYRNRRVATSLIAHIRQLHAEDLLFLHADEDDTPKDMYAKMGFDVVDRLYEYTCSKLEQLQHMEDDSIKHD